MKSMIGKIIALGTVSTVVMVGGVQVCQTQNLESTSNEVLLSKNTGDTYTASIHLINGFTKKPIENGTKVSYYCNGVKYNGRIGDNGTLTFKVNLKSKFIFISRVEIEGYKTIYNVDGMIKEGALHLFNTSYSTMPHKSEYNTISFIPYVEGVKKFPVTEIKVMDNNWQTFTAKQDNNGVFTASLGKEFPSNTVVEFIVPGMNIYTYTVGQLQNNCKVRFYGNEFNLKPYMKKVGSNGIRMMNTIQTAINEVSVKPVRDQNVILSVYGERRAGYTNDDGYVELKQSLMVTPYSNYSVLIQPPKNLTTEAIEDSHIGLARYTFGLPVVPMDLNNPKDNYFEKRVDMFSQAEFNMTLKVASNIPNGTNVIYSIPGVDNQPSVIGNAKVNNGTLIIPENYNTFIHMKKKTPITFTANGFGTQIINQVNSKIGDTTKITFSNKLDMNKAMNEGAVLLTITSEETGDNIDNSTVLIDGKKYRTNNNGQVLVSNLQVGSNTLNILITGYSSGSVEVDVKNGQTVDSSIGLIPYTGNENILIENAVTGQLLRNTVVTLDGMNMKTNSKGNLQLTTLWTGENSYTIGLSGYQASNANFNVIANQTGTMTLKLYPDMKELSKTITFINDRNNLGNNKVVYTLNGNKYTTNLESGKLDIRLNACNNEDVKLVVNINGYKKVEINGEVKDDVISINNIIDVTPIKRTVNIDTPNNWADITIPQSLDNIEGIRSTLIKKFNSKDLRFIVREDNGKYFVTITDNGFNVTNHNEKLLENIPLNIRLVKSGAVQLTLLSTETGSTLNNTIVIINGQRYRTNSNGIINVKGLKAGVDKININIKGYKDRDIEVSVIAGEVITNSTYISPQTGNEIIRLIDSAGNPIRNLKVNIGGEELITNDKGQVELYNLWCGQQDFTIEAKEYKSTAIPFNIVDNTTGNITVTLNK